MLARRCLFQQQICIYKRKTLSKTLNKDLVTSSERKSTVVIKVGRRVYQVTFDSIKIAEGWVVDVVCDVAICEYLHIVATHMH
jgi:hypothetical protein